MGTDIYVVMTGEEIHKAPRLPERIAYLGCHFEGENLVDIPQGLPEGSMLLIDDRNMPMDAGRSLAALKPLLHRLSGIYLDFQKESTGKFFAEAFVKNCPLPVGTSLPKIGTPVFSTRELHCLPGKRASPFWQEGVLTCWEVSITKDGFCKKEVPRIEGFSGHEAKGLFCSYQVSVLEDAAVFLFQNSREGLLAELMSSGAERALVFYRDMNS